ncbi:glycosyltransferase family 39 protein [Microlunatus spumicola]|uniref:Glycosyltransferase family 39 protein n=1 Tax=Microlunatus spumicola TaxID=81499 RepID=A0ABP6WSA5_9ACTN
MTTLQQRPTSPDEQLDRLPVRAPRALLTAVERPDESPRLRAGVVVASVVAMLAVGFWGLDRGSMWLDETATYTVVTRPVHQILAVLDHIDLVHGAYYLLMHVWMLPGGGEVWMRVPSVLAMGVAAAATAGLGTRLAGARTGLVAGLLFAGWPLVSYYAQEGRSYALVTGAVLAATYCLVRALSGGRRRWWWGYGLAIVVATTLNELAVLALTAHAVTVLLSRVGWRVWRWWAVAVLVCGALMVRVTLLSLEQADQVAHTAAIGRSTFVVLQGKFLGTSPWVLTLALGLVVLGVAAELRRWRHHEGGALAAVALPLLLVPVAALLAVSLVHPLFEVRYVLFCVAGLPLLAARGVEVLAALAARATSRTAVGWAVAGLLVAAVSLAQLPDLRHERTVGSRSQDFAGAAAVLRAQAQPGDAVIFLPMSFRLGALAYPEGFAQVDDVALQKTAVRAANLRGTARKPADVRAAMLERDRIWVFGTVNLRVKSTDKAGTNQMAVLDEHFVQERRNVVRGVEVDLYVRKDG